MQRKSNALNLQVVIKAAEWAVIVDDGALPASKKVQFVSWLRESPRHIEEFLAAAAVLHDCERIDRQKEIDIERLIQKAQNAAIVSIPSTTLRSDKQPGRFALNFQAFCTLAASLLLSQTTMLTAWHLPPSKAQIYATDIGELRTIQLEDKSIVHLNTDSKVAVTYSTNIRQIELVSGEANFDVQEDTARPFHVISGEITVEALDTEFNVHRTAKKVVVSLIEGTVLVFLSQQTAAHTSRITLTAGQQVEHSHLGRFSQVQQCDPKIVRAWKARRLVFDQQPLKEVANEFNRYNHMHIFLEKGDLDDHPISDVYDAKAPQALINFLQVTNVVEKKTKGYIENSKQYLRKKRRKSQ